MKRIIRSAAVALVVAVSFPAFAQATAGEKVDATANDVKRGTKKAVNRVDETLCTGTKAECAAKKGKHRVTETKDKVVDETKKAIDKVD